MTLPRWKIPPEARAEIARRFLWGESTRDLAREYGVRPRRINQLLRAQGVPPRETDADQERAAGAAPSADARWVQDYLAVYDDERVREWLEERLVRFLAGWHERWG